MDAVISEGEAQQGDDHHDEDTREEPLPGGVNVVIRVGNTVRKPAGVWTPAVHALLEHLAQQGFDGAPRAHGIDPKGRQILDYIPGEVGNYPLSARVSSETALVSAARLLRRYHDATASFPDATKRAWQLDAIEPAEVICHGDFAPYNCVFDEVGAVAVIDFDVARPGPREWDLAYALYRFAPFAGQSNQDGFATPAEQARRARRFLDAYDAIAEQRAITVSMLVPRLLSLIDFMQSSADAGDQGFAQQIADGHADLYRRDITYLETHAALWQQTVVGF